MTFFESKNQSNPTLVNLGDLPWLTLTDFTTGLRVTDNGLMTLPLTCYDHPTYHDHPRTYMTWPDLCWPSMTFVDLYWHHLALLTAYTPYNWPNNPITDPTDPGWQLLTLGSSGQFRNLAMFYGDFKWQKISHLSMKNAYSSFLNKSIRDTVKAPPFKLLKLFKTIQLLKF